MKKNTDQDIKHYDVHRTLHSHSTRQPTVEHDYSTAEDLKTGRKRRSWWARLLYIFLILCLLAAGIIGWDIYNFSNASQKIFGSGNLFQLLGPSSLKGQERGRVN